MRSRLSAEAYQLIANGGMPALRIRTLAQAAEVSQGAVLHHFADKDAIVLAAIEHALMLARDTSLEWLSDPGKCPETVLRAMLEEFRGFFFSDRFWVAIGITLEASKNSDLYPKVRSLVSGLRKPIYAAWEGQLVAHGWQADEARRDVRSAAAMVSGAAIRHFWADDDDVTRQIEEEWLAARAKRG